MPELPEVQTTVDGLRKTAVGRTVVDVWTGYGGTNIKYHKGKETIKDPSFFKYFKKKVVGKRIVGAERRAKYILIHIDDEHTVLIHMKMTGHLMHGIYEYKKGKDIPWLPKEKDSPLSDPFNRHIRLVFSFSDGTHLVLCDTRKFATVTILSRKEIHSSKHLKNIGPEPLSKEFTLDLFRKRILRRPRGRIKMVIMDQSVIAGVGNIYADESLWRSGIHPASIVEKVPKRYISLLHSAIKHTLSRGIDFGGDSMSDYRNIYGERGRFQEQHRAYRKTGTKCEKSGCKGLIQRIVIGGRSSHFCDRHQKRFS
jgi:formamidopyrimidine-DNA glycosylase